MAKPKVKGYGRERELVLLLERRGWWASRLPASGRRSGFDVVAAKGGKLVFFEVKARGSAEPVYLERWRWEEALDAAARAGAEAYLAVRVPPFAGGPRWWFRPLADPDSVDHNKALFRHPLKERERWVGFEELLSRLDHA